MAWVFQACLLKHVVEQANTWLHTVMSTHSKEVTKYLVTSLLQKLWPQSPGMSSTFHWLPPFSVRSQNSSCSGKKIHGIQLLAAALCIYCYVHYFFYWFFSIQLSWPAIKSSDLLIAFLFSKSSLSDKLILHTVKTQTSCWIPRFSRASWEMKSLQHVPGLPQWSKSFMKKMTSYLPHWGS